MIYTAPCVMLFIRQGGGGLALEIESFLGPVKWQLADGRVPFEAQKTLRCIGGFVPHADDNHIGPCRVQQQRGSRDHQYQ